MHDTTQSLPVLRITPSSFVVYRMPIDQKKRSTAQREAEKNLSRGDYNGYMSPKTKSKVSKYLQTWIDSIEEVNRTAAKNHLEKKPYLTFVTLTLPATQMHSDNEIKRKCLTPYIETLKRKYDVWNYFWRAESTKKGNIHFHLLIDSYIHHKAVREEWNRIVNKLGYVDRFESLHGHRDPNSTDIRKLRSVKSATAYVLKYVTKTQGYRPIDGRIHGCSDAVRELKPYEVFMEDEDRELLNEATEKEDCFCIVEECFTFISMKVLEYLKRKKSNRLEELRAYYTKVGSYMYSRECRPDAPTTEVFERLDADEATKSESVRDEIDFAIQTKIDFKPNWLVVAESDIRP